VVLGSDHMLISHDGRRNLLRVVLRAVSRILLSARYSTSHGKTVCDVRMRDLEGLQSQFGPAKLGFTAA
jgi:hypothetical protein